MKIKSYYSEASGTGKEESDLHEHIVHPKEFMIYYLLAMTISQRKQIVLSQKKNLLSFFVFHFYFYYCSHYSILFISKVKRQTRAHQMQEENMLPYQMAVNMLFLKIYHFFVLSTNAVALIPTLSCRGNMKHL